MPAIKRPLDDSPEREAPPTGLQDLINVALLAVAFVATGFGASYAHAAFSGGPRPEAQAATQVEPAPAGARVMIGQQWPLSAR